MKIRNVLSLFDGCSMARVALDRAGIKYDNYYASEIDKFAIQVAKKNYPDTIHLGDINTWSNWNLKNIDLIVGGSPCQGFSFAGKQLNFNDHRSKLFFVFHRIVKHYKPKYFLLENVRMKKEHENVISSKMGVAPIAINSALVSAQCRQRLYWCNWNTCQPKDKGILLEDIIDDGITNRKKSFCIDASYHKGTTVDDYFAKNRRQIIFTDNWHRKLTPIECERLQTLPDNYTEGVSKTQRYKILGNGFTVDVIAHLFRCMAKKVAFEYQEVLF